MLFHIRYNDIPIIKYKTDHTTGKSQLGGDNGGFIICEYKSILPLVISADKPPTVSGIAMLIKNLFKLKLKTLSSIQYIISNQLNQNSKDKLTYEGYLDYLMQIWMKNGSVKRKVR